MSEEKQTVNGLVVPGLGGTDLEKRKEETMKFIAAMGVLNSKNKNLKTDGKARTDLAEGDFFDYKTNQSLGAEIIACALTYRMRLRAYKKQGNSSVFQEAIYLERKSNGVYVTEQKYIDFTTKYAGKEYNIAQAMDLLVFLPELNEFRHFECKGMLDEGGVKFVDLSLPKGSTNYIPCRLKTIYGTAGDREWYELYPEQLTAKTVEFPDTAQKIMDMFNDVSAAEKDDNKQAVSSENNDKKRTTRTV